MRMRIFVQNHVIKQPLPRFLEFANLVHKNECKFLSLLVCKSYMSSPAPIPWPGGGGDKPWKSAGDATILENGTNEATIRGQTALCRR